jgi:hypothetical protein
MSSRTPQAIRAPVSLLAILVPGSALRSGRDDISAVIAAIMDRQRSAATKQSTWVRSDSGLLRSARNDGSAQ